MKKIVISLLMASMLLPFTGNAQEDGKSDKSVKEIEIQTSAQCEECKERIEKNIAYEKGVKYVDLDLETKILTVKYRADKTDDTKLRKAVAKIGYDADDVPADPEAYAKLPACCQKGGHDHPHD
jgi:copper chaperone CopZ